jgi:hypothetical protein
LADATVNVPVVEPDDAASPVDAAEEPYIGFPIEGPR